MVRFEEDKLVIEIPALCKNDALEKWMELQTSLCDIVRFAKDDTICDNLHISIDLLRELLPDLEDAKKMTV